MSLFLKIKRRCFNVNYRVFFTVITAGLVIHGFIEHLL